MKLLLNMNHFSQFFRDNFQKSYQEYLLINFSHYAFVSIHAFRKSFDCTLEAAQCNHG